AGLSAPAFIVADRPDSSRSMAEAAPLETTIRAGCGDQGHGAGVEGAGRISLRQRHRRLLRLDACAFCAHARFSLDRRTRAALARAVAELHDDTLRTQGRARRPHRHLSQVQENWRSGRSGHWPIILKIRPSAEPAKNSPPAPPSKASDA